MLGIEINLQVLPQIAVSLKRKVECQVIFEGCCIQFRSSHISLFSSYWAIELLNYCNIGPVRKWHNGVKIATYNKRPYKMP